MGVGNGRQLSHALIEFILMASLLATLKQEMTLRRVISGLLESAEGHRESPVVTVLVKSRLVCICPDGPFVLASTLAFQRMPPVSHTQHFEPWKVDAKHSLHAKHRPLPLSRGWPCPIILRVTNRGIQ